MKSIVTLLFILTCGVIALANTNNHTLQSNLNIESYDEIQSTQMGDILDSGIVVATYYNEVETATENSVARLYKFKNSRITKALAFKTKRNKAVMA